MTPEEVGAHVAAALAREARPTAPTAGTTAADTETAGDKDQVAVAGEAGDATSGTAGVEVSVSGGGDWARATVDVPVALWRTAIRLARDDAALAMTFFDWLSAVDEVDAGFRIVAHLWSPTARHGLLLRTLVPRDNPRVPSIVDIYPGAAWHERETHEMFGVYFDGHPDLRPLLLAPEFEGHPLRKEFVLASRVVKPWPGAKEPGESDHQPAGRGRRQPMRPPGVPAPEEWGPRAQPLGEGDG